MEKVIIVLGHKNDNQGNLSPLSIARCELALDIFKQQQNARLICTGGYGDNFNQTAIAHSNINKQYLISKGIQAEHFLPSALSRFTIEDATLSYPVLKQLNSPQVDIISSDFHIPRVQLIFDKVMPSISKNYLSAPSPISVQELSKLKKHEVFAIKRDKEALITETNNT
ncbi:YdcF family protein [Pseudoalteromonas umbrosa]|uniref:YdcF family protein n=1 Tax=Pseudoalteromonas umbrosa TaxID=3048489 RepID=UPI0024C3D78C|nr:YdcF family protein [Pseudoalteromonas sp. B95]MDK1287635.1 YdcF family protein [Pseudoalteromonas sp. B95]